MSFFKKLFSKNEKSPLPDIQFGRYSDSYKNELKYDAWDIALTSFEKKEYLKSFELFLSYLLDDDIENVTWTTSKDQLEFTLYQGSKIIYGRADRHLLVTECKIASFTQPNIGVFRKLLEENYMLKYSRYAIDDQNNLTIIFSTQSLDASPYKLYYALKELATMADKKDDVITYKYDELSPINNHHIRNISTAEKEIKFNYFKEALDEALETINSTALNLSQHPGAISYVYLDVAFRIDYLLKPEGQTMEAIDKINKLYFRDQILSIDQKNTKIKNILENIKGLQRDEFYEELYEVKSTFGSTVPTGKSKVSDFIKGEIQNMDWYLQQGHDSVALAIPSYIVGYSLYSYSLPKPLRSLLSLYYQVQDYPYFQNLGFDQHFVNNRSLLKKEINREILRICTKYRDVYDRVIPNLRELDYDSIHSFAKSYLLMVSDLDFTRKDMR